MNRAIAIANRSAECNFRQNQTIEKANFVANNKKPFKNKPNYKKLSYNNNNNNKRVGGSNQTQVGPRIQQNSKQMFQANPKNVTNDANKVCFRCHQKGHLVANCKVKRTNVVETIEDPDEFVNSNPVVFIRLMNRILGNKKFVEVYFDDIIIHSHSFDEHLIHVKEVLNIIYEAGLKLQGKKCRWFARQTKILGHIVSKSKIEMDSGKIEALKTREPPKNIKQLQEFMGLCNYYRRFIENFARISSPLTELMKKDKPFVWGGDESKAFKSLIEMLTSYPILRQPDFSRPFIVSCDASNCAIGAILAQKDDTKREYVCAYASRILKGAECHYGITEKECLAHIWAIKYFRVYLYGTRFTVITDHAALTWLMKLKEPTGRLARWSAYLQDFQFDIVYKKGSSRLNANALSRPVLLSSISRLDDANDAYISDKSLDPYDDDNLIYYLTYRKHNSGLSVKQVKRIEKASKNFSIEIDQLGNYRLLFIKDGQSKPLIVPKPDERIDLIKKAHLLGHFQTDSTLKRLQDEYNWKNMRDDVEKVVKSCIDCCRNHKTITVDHGAKALEISSIFQRVGIDLTLGSRRLRKDLSDY